MRLFYESDAQLARLERDAEHRQYARLLLGDGWRWLSEYVYDRSYVYAAAVSQSHLYQLFIGRGGKYQTSDWWTPHQRGVPVPLYVTHWQPLPPGVDPLTHSIDLFPPADPPPSRPPEPVYEPGPATAKLTPGPRALLVAMRDGAMLRECGQRWSSWTVQRLGGEPEKLTARPVDRLRELAFIAVELDPGSLGRRWKTGRRSVFNTSSPDALAILENSCKQPRHAPKQAAPFLRAM